MIDAVWNKGPLLTAHSGLRCVNVRGGDDGIHTHTHTHLRYQFTQHVKLERFTTTKCKKSHATVF